MAALYRQFSAAPLHFETNDLRCKIQPIERLSQGHWLIDRDWDDEEKKELKIEEEITEMTENEFNELLADINKTISEYLGHK